MEEVQKIQKNILSFEKSRRMMLIALALLFVSQFFQYEGFGQTTMTLNLSTHLISGGLPYGGSTGWELHAWWFYLPLWGGCAYLFYTASRSAAFYWASGVLFILMGLGSDTGGWMGLGSILLFGYAIYLKTKEKPVQEAANDLMDTKQ